MRTRRVVVCISSPPVVIVVTSTNRPQPQLIPAITADRTEGSGVTTHRTAPHRTTISPPQFPFPQCPSSNQSQPSSTQLSLSTLTIYPQTPTLISPTPSQPLFPPPHHSHWANIPPQIPSRLYRPHRLPPCPSRNCTNPPNGVSTSSISNVCNISSTSRRTISI